MCRLLLSSLWSETDNLLINATWIMHQLANKKSWHQYFLRPRSHHSQKQRYQFHMLTKASDILFFAQSSWVEPW